MFQSAPLTGARGDTSLNVGIPNFFVSIRSPDRSQGRPTSLARYSQDLRFQSAPLTGARGDTNGRP